MLSTSFDESDKNNNSILNVIATIRTGNEVKRLTLNGITLMAKKTSDATSEKILETFEHAQSWQQECHDAYDNALRDYVDRGKIYPGMSKQDYEAYDWTDEKNSADGQIGNPAMTSLTRNKSSCTDHCGPAKSSNKKAKAAAKSIPAMIKMYDEEWGRFSESEKKELVRLHLYGCQHHLRNIGYSNGMKAVAEHIRPLIADDVEEAKACGVQCVTGEIGMGMRSILKFFGNTTLVDFRSVGGEFQRWCSTHPTFSKQAFLRTGRCDLGQRQDGAAEQSWKLDLLRSAMLEFILCYNWSESDINYYAAIQLFLESTECESERVLYALIFHQVCSIISADLIIHATSQYSTLCSSLGACLCALSVPGPRASSHCYCM